MLVNFIDDDCDARGVGETLCAVSQIGPVGFRGHAARLRNTENRSAQAKCDEELLITLHHGRCLLTDPKGLLFGNDESGPSAELGEYKAAGPFNPHVFSADGFVDVIETEAVWENAVVGGRFELIG